MLSAIIAEKGLPVQAISLFNWETHQRIKLNVHNVGRGKDRRIELWESGTDDFFASGENWDDLEKRFGTDYELDNVHFVPKKGNAR